MPVAHVYWQDQPTPQYGVYDITEITCIVMCRNCQFLH